jgi:hypothetical protein
VTKVNAPVFYTTADDPPEVHPALVSRVNGDGTVDLYVYFPEGSGPIRVRNVPQGRHPNSWFDAVGNRDYKKYP